MSLTPEPSQFRISDADRERAAEALREAAAVGRLDFDELDQRLEGVWAAKTQADLTPILADLPEGERAAPEPVRSPAPLAPSYSTSFAMFSGSQRQGVWQVPATYQAFALFGGVDLDLRRAVFTRPETVIIANAVFGGVNILVNEDTRVIVEGFGFLGGYVAPKDESDRYAPGTPIVRVKGVATFGGVSVERRKA